MSRNEDLLLNEYKKYDYLNSDKENPLIKILVSYIKPSYLFKSKILTPMHLGRSVATEVSKDGEVSEDDLKWLYDNCIGDDDFDGSTGVPRLVRINSYFYGSVRRASAHCGYGCNVIFIDGHLEWHSWQELYTRQNPYFQWW